MASALLMLEEVKVKTVILLKIHPFVSALNFSVTSCAKFTPNNVLKPMKGLRMWKKIPCSCTKVADHGATTSHRCPKGLKIWKKFACSCTRSADHGAITA